MIDSKNMRDKIKNEEEERARKEREMADKMKEAAAASENEILTLHKRMAAENAKRIDEINELRYEVLEIFIRIKPCHLNSDCTCD